MQKVTSNITRGILFVVLLIGAFVLRARASAVLCDECYGTPTKAAYCDERENGRIKLGTCKPKDQTSCTGVRSRF